MHLPPAYAELRPARQIVADLKNRRRSLQPRDTRGAFDQRNSAGKSDITFGKSYLSTMVPSFIIHSIILNDEISLVGSPFTAIMSACNPLTNRPISFSL
jgi:hypothetical protein